MILNCLKFITVVLNFTVMFSLMASGVTETDLKKRNNDIAAIILMALNCLMIFF